jgi:hypothetical protein
LLDRGAGLGLSSSSSEALKSGLRKSLWISVVDDVARDVPGNTSGFLARSSVVGTLDPPRTLDLRRRPDRENLLRVETSPLVISFGSSEELKDQVVGASDE